MSKNEDPIDEEENRLPSAHQTVSSSYEPTHVESSKLWTEPSEAYSWAKKAILSLDGGGVRSLSTLYILKHIMDEIGKIEQGLNPPAYSSEDSPLVLRLDEEKRRKRSKCAESRFLPCHYFDYIAGTSTGGLIAILLGRQRVNVEIAIKQYENFLVKAFERTESRFKHLLSLHEGRFARDNLMSSFLDVQTLVEPSDQEQSSDFRSDDTRCKTIAYALSGSPRNESFTPYRFRSYSVPTKLSVSESVSLAPSYSTVKVACAISAGSKYLQPYCIGTEKFYDATIVLNNPSWETYNEVTRISGDTNCPIDVLLSLGSGLWVGNGRQKDGTRSRRFNTLNRSRKTHLRDSQNISATVHKNVQVESERAKNLRYNRLEVDSGLSKVQPNEWTPSAADRVRTATTNYLERPDISDMITECARILVMRRRERSQTLQWETFALGTRYRCPIENCEYAKRGSKPFGDRNALADHLQIHHGKPPPGANKEIEMLLDRGRTNSWE